jgi:predicted alpha/beta hydrolase family esterase
MSVQPTVVIVPGLRDHVADHWQTLLGERLARWACVPRLGKGTLPLAAWVEALESTLRKIEGPVFLAAHSAGVLIVAHWARVHRRPIAGALLATPPDLVTPMPAQYPSLDTLAQNGWLPLPRLRLPFPSIVAASSNDPLAQRDRVADLAAAWGASLYDAGAVGHLNAASGFGEWPAATELLQVLGLPRTAFASPGEMPRQETA